MSGEVTAFQDYVISSADRDFATESISAFEQIFPERLPNVFAVELLNIVLPNVGNVRLEPTLKLNINKGKWRRVAHTTSHPDGGQDTSFIIQPLPYNAADTFIRCGIMTHPLIHFGNHCEPASSIKFELREMNGNLFTFGGLASANSKSNSIIMTLRIHHKPFLKK